MITEHEFQRVAAYVKNKSHSFCSRPRKSLQIIANVYGSSPVDDAAHQICQFYEKMAPGGYLFIGSTESMGQNNTRFQYVKPSIYRK